MNEDNTEFIGKVCLHTEYYDGLDHYSEGALEDEMLEIAMEDLPIMAYEEIARRGKWSVTYHFSPLRGNVIRWHPCLQGAKVLEIGSGCGAVTGAIADEAAKTICVELSKKRSLINAYRNRNKESIDIYVGNFERVEKDLPFDFDIVTLIGVLEYAKAYIDSETAFSDLIESALKHLAKDGHLLIAIENRLGIKYFAGCAEDHTGLSFDGIEGYPTGKIRTFSRPKLEELLSNSSAVSWEFYYPYPDYKFAVELYSDKCLPRRGTLTENTGNADVSRLVLFDESKAIDSIIDDGLFPLFSNSFLIDVRK